MNDEKETQQPESADSSAPSLQVTPVSEDHAAALELAASAETPEDQAAADALVKEAAEAAVEPVEPSESEAPVVTEPEADSVKKSLGDEVHEILTSIENGVEELLHSPLALVQWVKTKVAEAKAKL